MKVDSRKGICFWRITRFYSRFKAQKCVLFPMNGRVVKTLDSMESNSLEKLRKRLSVGRTCYLADDVGLEIEVWL